MKLTYPALNQWAVPRILIGSFINVFLGGRKSFLEKEEAQTTAVIVCSLLLLVKAARQLILTVARFLFTRCKQTGIDPNVGGSREAVSTSVKKAPLSFLFHGG